MTYCINVDVTKQREELSWWVLSIFRVTEAFIHSSVHETLATVRYPQKTYECRGTYATRLATLLQSRILSSLYILWTLDIIITSLPPAPQICNCTLSKIKLWKSLCEQYCKTRNFGKWKLWSIWRIGIKLPNFNLSK